MGWEIKTKRERIHKVFQAISIGKESLRKLAVKLGISKSSIHRTKKGIKQREALGIPFITETEEGIQWLNRLVTALIYVFNLKGGVGCQLINEFFTKAGLSNVAGLSESSIWRIREKMINLIKTYSVNQNQEICKELKKIELQLGGDETFYKEFMILVMMDLPSGYIFLEETSKSKDYETWYNKATSKLNNLVIDVKSFTSDRAGALIKLGEKGLNCLHVSDVFHYSYGIVKVFGSKLALSVKHAKNKLDDAKMILSDKLSSAKGQLYLFPMDKEIEQEINDLSKDLKGKEEHQNEYHEQLHRISKIIHPFSYINSQKQTSKKAESSLLDVYNKLKELAIDVELLDKKNRIENFKDQVQDMVTLIDQWWEWVLKSISEEKLSETSMKWLLEILLPLVYWLTVIKKTKNPVMRAEYKKQLEYCQKLKSENKVPDELLNEKNKWYKWASKHSNMFQRSSSAIEGRNGYLSMINHCTRGITINLLETLTVIHNFDIKRDDSSTPAERLFNKKFPDLFEYVFSNMDELPLPRHRKKIKTTEMLIEAAF